MDIPRQLFRKNVFRKNACRKRLQEIYRLPEVYPADCSLYVHSVE
jgi:hypothetical protein